MMDMCDSDGNEVLNKCEVHDCVLAAENAYRAEFCPDFGMAYCENPFFCATCEGAWDCEMIE